MTQQSFNRFATSTMLAPNPTNHETPKQKSERINNLEEMMKIWKLMVGFEFHVQIKTKHKMFSSKV